MTAYNRLSQEEFEKRVHKANPSIVVIGKYSNQKTGVSCYCNDCGYGKDIQWNPYPATVYKTKACPICAGRQLNILMIGYNDLETWCRNNNRQDILDDWDTISNITDPNTPNTPSEVARSAPKQKIHWKCHVCKHEWTATPNHRTKQYFKTGHGSGCPHCAKSGTSFSEQAILFYLTQHFNTVLHRDKTAIGSELDIYLPTEKTAIEFDGRFYHKEKITHDNKKDTICHEKGIRLIRLRDSHLPDTKYAERITCSTIQDGKSFEGAISELFALLSIPSPTISLKKDYPLIIEAFKMRHVENSLENKYPEIAKEWHPEKNYGLLPSNFTAGEDYPAWWKCRICNHEWQSAIYSRTQGKHGCYKCGLKKQGTAYSRRRANEMSLAQWCIENSLFAILDEWDSQANMLDPNCFNSPDKCPHASSKEIHWICNTNPQHKWTASPAERIIGKKKCPECRGIVLIVGENDLETWCHENGRDDILLDWDTDTNLKDTLVPSAPSLVRFDQYKEVHWKCHKCPHKWKSRVADRTIHGKGCEKCSNIKRSRKRQKEVRNVDTGIVYASIKDAEIAIHGKVGTQICECCKGKKETAYGYHWEYIASE